MGFQLVCTVVDTRQPYQKKDFNLLISMNPSGQVIYSKRGISIEPLIEHIKSIFRIDPLPIRGYEKISVIVLLSVLLYQILVYYNYKMQKNGIRTIKYMVGC